LLLLLLLTVCFTLATALELPYRKVQEKRPKGVLAALLGDGRRIFAKQFFTEADAYFHSGYYPSIFDNRDSFQTPHIAADAGLAKDENQGDELAFMGKPRDFIEDFSRNFMPSSHTHLDQGGAEDTNKLATLGESAAGEVREILPWLRISAELDPNRIDTYTVAAYWLRNRMGKTYEAEEFLREGLRANPYNPSLLFELGLIYEQDRKDPTKARNIWELAVSKYDEQNTSQTNQEEVLLNLTLHLARLEESQTNLPVAIKWLKREKTLSPSPDRIEAQIMEDEAKLQTNSSTGNPMPQ